jgi:hypothetical protein
VTTGTVAVFGGTVGLLVGLAVGEFSVTLVGDDAGLSEIVAIVGDAAGDVAGGCGAGDATAVGLPNMIRATAISAEKNANSSEPRA